MTAVIAHGGGPTAVLNASLAGAIDESRRQAATRNLLGARFGVRGLLADEFYDLSGADTAAMREAPGSAIGSSRQEIRAEDYDRLFDVFARRDVRYFFYTGGNGSMDTAMRVHHQARDRGYELTVVGIPKTIDNDIQVTDHTPGYGSVARFFAHAVRDIGEDNRSLPSPVCVVESLGRNAGWVAASTALARHHDDDPPHLIYFPEQPVNEDKLMADVERVYARLGRVVIVACEGQMNDRGLPFGADVDRSENALHKLASNLGHMLAKLITARLGVRARAEKPGLLGRSCAVLASTVDRAESYECGIAAVRAAVSGDTGHMIALRRGGGTFLTPLESVARKERLFPTDWIAASGCDVTAAFLDYVRPLAGPIPAHFRL
jgi:6-phosphofructokinase